MKKTASAPKFRHRLGPGKTLLLFGFGRIGRKVAKLAQAFGMRVAAHDPFTPDAAIRAAGAEPVACSGQCVDLASDAENCGGCGSYCVPHDEVCFSGQCLPGSCPTGLTSCVDACVDTKTDRLSCGACGRACPTGHLCASGTCQ